MLRKFATHRILGSRIFDGTSQSLMRTAHRAEFDFTPRHGYLYVRSRMISSRCNDNFDEFPGNEIESGYLTFLGKPVFVNHHNEDHRRMRGLIVDAALHKDANPDGSPDIWVEGLMEVDALTFPKLAASILKGDVDRTSMGVDVAFSVCAVCNNKATTPLEYCRHIPGQKGSRFARRTANGTHNELIRERCHGLSFFENSLLVEQPADPTAYFLDKPVLGPGLEHLSMNHRTASRRQASAPQYAPVRVTPSMISHVAALPVLASGGSCPGCSGLNTIAVRREAECMDCGHLFTARTAPPEGAEEIPYPVRPSHPTTGKPMSDDTLKKFPKERAQWNASKKAHSDAWHAANPVSAQNIVDHWHAATEDEKDQGMNWYSDAHHATKAIAQHTGTPMHVAAGLVSNYSPQTHWATNITTAARVMRTKQPLGGKGNKDGLPGEDGTPKGILASDSQKQVAHKMINEGGHYEQLLGGPKTKAFAHLINHGDDTEEDKANDTHRVVVDRHALSVAAGARATDVAYAGSGLSGKGIYNHHQDLYREAARQISEHEGHEVKPHQVQAGTWLVRQRLNQEHDRQMGMNGSRSASAAQTAIKQMNSYMGEHHPEMSHDMPGTGYSKNDEATPLEKLHYEDHAVTHEELQARKGKTASWSRRGR